MRSTCAIAKLVVVGTCCLLVGCATGGHIKCDADCSPSLTNEIAAPYAPRLDSTPESNAMPPGYLTPSDDDLSAPPTEVSEPVVDEPAPSSVEPPRKFEDPFGPEQLVPPAPEIPST
ncbi:hypothetical protein Pan189_33450 [Stratiformator vulcanicus]|uniref:Secreted protein n=1 Tax=Stratiformator vulcanicus TaxID=2527980 RepID=A0A517R4Y4_9PLAN|nr:hypothetical protein Pan189_33450 [Stratiformator vulcanicus]